MIIKLQNALQLRAEIQLANDKGKECHLFVKVSKLSELALMLAALVSDNVPFPVECFLQVSEKNSEAT